MWYFNFQWLKISQANFHRKAQIHQELEEVVFLPFYPSLRWFIESFKCLLSIHVCIPSYSIHTSKQSLNNNLFPSLPLYSKLNSMVVTLLLLFIIEHQSKLLGQNGITPSSSADLHLYENKYSSTIMKKKKQLFNCGKQQATTQERTLSWQSLEAFLIWLVQTQLCVLSFRVRVLVLNWAQLNAKWNVFLTHHHQ